MFGIRYVLSILFQSTLPARGATVRRQGVTVVWTLFQSTLPARGATSLQNSQVISVIYFNPRSPHGERPASCCPCPVSYTHLTLPTNKTV